MLKTMRKNVKSLAPVLWIVIATFIIAIFAVWGGAGRLGESRRENTIVQIGKADISVEDYFNVLRQRVEAMKKEYPDLNPALLRQAQSPPADPGTDGPAAAPSPPGQEKRPEGHCQRTPGKDNELPGFPEGWEIRGL